MKNLFLISIISVIISSCSKGDRNPLIIPPNYSEVPNLNDTKKTQENVGNQENIDKLKKMLQESDENQQ